MTTIHPHSIRLAVLAFAIPAIAACASRTIEEVSTGQVMPAASAPGLLDSWPEKQRQTANELMSKYGQPDVINEQMVVWMNRGPFVKTVIARTPVAHNFPMPHMDYLTQTIRHRVPADRMDELFEYDGSVFVHRTRGEMSAECDLEPMNFLALNLAHDVAMGRRTPAEARAFYAQTAMAFKQGDKSSPYVNGLIFQQEANAADPDRPHQM